MLTGIRVVELADQTAEFAGKLLAGLGAEVLKVEPPGGSATRQIGPFYTAADGGTRGPPFWHSAPGKSSVTVDPGTNSGRKALQDLVGSCNVLLESVGPGELANYGIDCDQMAGLNPSMVQVSVTPFGQDGPMSTWRSCDLVSMALGGAAMLTGYTAEPHRPPSTPIVPQMWHACHITGAHAALATLGALAAVDRSGAGQRIDVSVHRSLNFDTIADIQVWLCDHQPVQRQTAQYAAPEQLRDNLVRSRDGKYMLNYLYQPRHYVALARLLSDIGRPVPGVEPDAEPLSRSQCTAIDEAAHEWIASADFDDDAWRLAHRYRLNWAPVREPVQALDDPYWQERGALVAVYHEESGRSFFYPDRPWIASRTPWRAGRRAPGLGEHNHLLDQPAGPRSGRAPAPPGGTSERTSRELPLADVRIVDLTWIVAGAGATRILAALGAETIKVEWRDNLDALRLSGPLIPVQPQSPPGDETDRRSLFAEMNAGKLSVSLNMKTDEGRDLMLRLVAESDVVVENMAPGALERAGLGYEELQRANPEIIFAQLSGFGQNNRYSGFISTAPVAEAFSGLTSQSGQPEPAPPAGWGYPYLDIASSYYLAMALLGALHHRRATGKGQRIDCSLADTGLFLTGTALLDHQATGRRPERQANRAHAIPAAPHGIYPCKGQDRWIAICAFDETQWSTLLAVADDRGELSADPRFGSLSGRLAHQDELDDRLRAMTSRWEAYELMTRLQEAGVPAGVCQTSQDRVEQDAQLRHDRALVALPSLSTGPWPIRDLPWRTTPDGPAAGGSLGRGFPAYGQDTASVLSHILGLNPSEIDELAEKKVV